MASEVLFDEKASRIMTDQLNENALCHVAELATPTRWRGWFGMAPEPRSGVPPIQFAHGFVDTWFLWNRRKGDPGAPGRGIHG
jgi:hypothetical protein